MCISAEAWFWNEKFKAARIKLELLKNQLQEWRQRNDLQYSVREIGEDAIKQQISLLARKTLL